jgi:hypothetical protein
MEAGRLLPGLSKKAYCDIFYLLANFTVSESLNSAFST